jgi:hypothetical protein
VRRRDAYLLVGFSGAVVFFAAISIGVNALAPDVPTTSNATADDSRVQDSNFVLHLGSTNTPDLPQQDLIALGRSVCTSFDAKRSRQSVGAGLESRGLTSGQASVVMTAAVNAYCPGHRATITSS